MDKTPLNKSGLNVYFERTARCISQSFSLVLIAVLALSTIGLSANDSKRKIIIGDDGFSLMHLLLLGAEDVEVIGITTVTGNEWANRVTAYNLRGLELLGKTDVPVAEGATYPLVNTEKQTELWEKLYGRLTWKGAWMKEWVEETIQEAPTYYGPKDPVDDLPWGAPKTKPTSKVAANFMIEMVRKYPGEVTILEAGPLTNIALAQRLDPEFARLAKELVYMGGSFNPQQTLDNEVAAQFAREFKNSPRREFNIRLDPEAASIVSRAPWKKVTVIPIDPSTSTQLTPELLNKLADVAPPALGEVMRDWESGFPLWDEIAGAVWLVPSLIEKQDTLYVDYNTTFGPSYGDTLSWSEGYQPGLGERPAHVVRSVHGDGIESLLFKNVGQLNQE